MAPSQHNKNTTQRMERGISPIMKQSIFKKTSGLVASLLTVTALAPVLAFAAPEIEANTGSYDKYAGTVNAVVYSDQLNTSTVTLGIYGDDKTTLLRTVSSSTYTVVNGQYKYQFSVSNINNATVNNSVYLQAAADNVAGSVYGLTNSSNGGGGGGGSVTPPNAGGAVPVSVDGAGKVDKTVLENIIKGNANAAILIPGESVALPAAAFGAGVSLKIVTSTGSYLTLPLNKINLADLAKDLGVAVADLYIKVTIKTVTGADADKVSNGVKKVTGVTQKSKSVDFVLGVIGKDGKDAVLNTSYLGNTYIERGIVTDGAVDQNKATGVVYDPATDTISFVPTVFTTADGKTTAAIKRNTTSIYTVVETNKSLTDLAGHWAKPEVDLLVNKLVVQGATDTTFEPQRSITRAEFAALIVRALGLNSGDKTASTYKDVAADAWYTGVVNAAAGANLIQGYEDGTFRPDSLITREELSALVIRALKFAGQEVSVSSTEQATLLAKFTDASAIKWGQNEVAAAVKAGIVNGQTDTTLATNSNATRAESAAMLKRFLTKSAFINN